FFFFSSRRRHTRLQGDWSSDVCSSDLEVAHGYLCLTSRCGVISGRGCFSRDEGYCPRRNEERARECNARSAYRACTGFHLASYRSEERRVGKECISRWGQSHYTKQDDR